MVNLFARKKHFFAKKWYNVKHDMIVVKDTEGGNNGEKIIVWHTFVYLLFQCGMWKK